MQWLRKLTIEYGDPQSSDGPPTPWILEVDSASDFRVQFNFTRTNTSKTDGGMLRMFNLPKEFSDAIRAGHKSALERRQNILERFERDLEKKAQELRTLARANRVRVYAGYRDETYLIFIGDIGNLKTAERRSGSTDNITEMMLGDTLISLKFGYLNKLFGPGSPYRMLFNAIPELAGINLSEQAKKQIRSFESVPNTLGISILKASNGYAARGGVGYVLDDLVEQLGLQWFVKDGEIFYMGRGQVFDDFALFLEQDLNVLSRITSLNEHDVQFRAFLDGRLVPGRGVQIIDSTGKKHSNHGYRVDTVVYRGDTHGSPWYSEITASELDQFTAVLAKRTFTAMTTAEAEAAQGFL